MDDRQKRIIEALGLSESQFEPDEPINTRLDDMSDAILELTEIIGGTE